ncbi:serine hydrolase domain-containing protein [Legionella sp. D16C41]|uniref:serine hydrolase domain-containing protein n=1 Tax=Legionella sp. D16C41 TaxID=3402688 RepID=UPI003AF72D64
MEKNSVHLINHTSAYELYFPNKENRLSKLKDLFPAIDKLYQKYNHQYHVPGYAFGVILDGLLVHSGSGGYLNLKEKLPTTTQSMFRIASMTKSFTAMAILKLRDEGKLRLDDCISDYIPNLNFQPPMPNCLPVTIRDLLIHQAGLPSDDPWGDRHLNLSQPELNRLIKQGFSWANPPRTAFEYSSLGYVLLGLIIERVTGKAYQKVIAETIWQPLGMTQVSWEVNDICRDNLAQGYRWYNGGFYHEPLLSDGCFAAMGGMICSLESFSHYVALHQLGFLQKQNLDNKILKASTICEMQQAWSFSELNNYQFLDGQQTVMMSGYGYGLRYLQDGANKVYIGHAGGLPGFGSNWFIMPDYGLGLILLTNATYAPTSQINLQILNFLIKEACLPRRQLNTSLLLDMRKRALIALLPNWQDVEANSIFADNFFLDCPLKDLRVQTSLLFQQAGPIYDYSDVVAESQLRGSFLAYGEKANIKINFSLTPQNPALIQECQFVII